MFKINWRQQINSCIDWSCYFWIAMATSMIDGTICYTWYAISFCFILLEPNYGCWYLIISEMNTCIWVRSQNCGCLVTWFCYQLIAKPGNKTATVSWPDPYDFIWRLRVVIKCSPHVAMCGCPWHLSWCDLRKHANNWANQNKSAVNQITIAAILANMICVVSNIWYNFRTTIVHTLHCAPIDDVDVQRYFIIFFEYMTEFLNTYWFYFQLCYIKSTDLSSVPFL